MAAVSKLGQEMLRRLGEYALDISKGRKMDRLLSDVVSEAASAKLQEGHIPEGGYSTESGPPIIEYPVTHEMLMMGVKNFCEYSRLGIYAELSETIYTATDLRQIASELDFIAQQQAFEVLRGQE